MFRVPGSWVPGSGFQVLENRNAEQGTREPGTRNLEPGTTYEVSRVDFLNCSSASSGDTCVRSAGTSASMSAQSRVRMPGGSTLFRYSAASDRRLVFSD